MSGTVNIPVEPSAEVWLLVAAVLFNIVPQLFDIVAACIFISTALEPWIAVIVFITLGSYIPVTIILTERRVKYRRQVVLLSRCLLCLCLGVVKYVLPLHAMLHACPPGKVFKREGSRIFVGC